jgi:hypothetical protein
MMKWEKIKHKKPEWGSVMPTALRAKTKWGERARRGKSLIPQHGEFIKDKPYPKKDRLNA